MDDDEVSDPRPRSPLDDQSRVLALSDGVFAIAMTLLVLNLTVPEGLQTAADVNHDLQELWPDVWALLLSFAVLGRYWVVHRRLLTTVRRIDTWLLTFNLAFLFPVALMPFAAKLLADYGNYPVPVIIYAATIAAIGIFLTAIGEHGYRNLGRERAAGESVLSGLAVVAVFLISIPIALVSADGAKWCWFILFPALAVVGRLEQHARDDATELDTH